MNLPDIELVSESVHAAWVQHKLDSGVTTRILDGEELMVPYADLSEKAKELDRVTVRTVYAAILTCQLAEDLPVEIKDVPLVPPKLALFDQLLPLCHSKVEHPVNLFEVGGGQYVIPCFSRVGMSWEFVPIFEQLVEEGNLIFLLSVTESDLTRLGPDPEVVGKTAIVRYGTFNPTTKEINKSPL